MRKVQSIEEWLDQHIGWVERDIEEQCDMYGIIHTKPRNTSLDEDDDDEEEYDEEEE